jgi:hypothetical protein
MTLRRGQGMGARLPGSLRPGPFCGTAALVVPVLEVDGRPVGDSVAGEVTRWLRGEPRAIAGRTNGRHEAWTTPVYGEGRT